MCQLVLTDKQTATIAAAFARVASEEGTVSTAQVETLATQLFKNALTDDMLDVIIDLTEGTEVVTREDFVDIIAAVMEKTTIWGSLATPIAGSQKVFLHEL